MDVNKYVAEKIKYYRNSKNITQDELAEMLGTTYQSISRYETGDRKTNNELLFKLSKIFNVSINDFFPPVDNGEFDSITIGDFVRVPVLGTIKAGIPIEAQEDLLGYVDIPESMFYGGRDYFGLKLSGNSMTPEYHDGEIVIFEKTNDIARCNGEDCAVMVNHTECTFKQFFYDNEGVTLVPYNKVDFNIKHYSPEEAENLPITIIGLALGSWRPVKRKNPEHQDEQQFNIIQ